MTRLPIPTLLVLIIVLANSVGCVDENCLPSSSPSVTLGQGVGGAFAEIMDGQQVSLTPAPQGGQGVPVIIRTQGLAASNSALADVQLDTLVEGQLAGSFLLEEARLLCRGDGEGGEISGTVVGFDPDQYQNNDDFIELNGREVGLDVTVYDEEDGTATILQLVTLIVGG